MNRGTPTRAVTTPTGSSRGRTTVLARASASTRNAPRGEEDRWQQPAVEGPDESAHGVGDHQPHEPDDAADRDAGRGEE